MTLPNVPDDEWWLIANALETPLPQLIAVGVRDSVQLHEVERRLLALAGNRTLLRLWLRLGQETSEDALRQARGLAMACKSHLPLLIIVLDVYPETPEQQQQLVQFWRGMNQLRENWHSLPAQVLFLLSPDAYRHLSLDADHLKRWIAPKIRLWQGANDIKMLALSGSTNLQHDTEGYRLPDPRVPAKTSVSSCA